MKKLLALVLALVMTLGLATVSSSAAYSDAADVSLNEAVDVMSAVGVFQGSDGKFSPKENLTREQAAKLIAYLDLGETAAEALPGVKVFSDVEATRWSAKYIAYCQDAGYIAGVGDGKFNPTGELTGYAFGKMVLCVLGYDADIEGFTGNAWSINVAKLMEKNDIAKGVSGAASATLTREQAAQYCLNALKATMVEYDTKGTSIEINGAKIATGASKTSDVEVAHGTPYARAISKAADKAKETVQLGEKLYDGDLKLDKDGHDDFLQPANVWTYKNEKVGTYTKSADATLTNGYTYGDLYTALGKTVADSVRTKNASVLTVYMNGKDVTKGAKNLIGENDFAAINEAKLAKGDKTDLLQTILGNGTTTNVYITEGDDGEYDVDLYITYQAVAKVTSVTAATASADRKINLTAKSNVIGMTRGINAYETEDFAKNDYVLFTYTVDDDGVASVQDIKLATVTDAIDVASTRSSASKPYFTAGGNTYYYDANFAPRLDAGTPNVAVGSTYKFYLDDAGMALYAEAYNKSENYSDYLVLVALKKNDDFGTLTAQAKAVKLDGTILSKITIDSLDNSDIDTANTGLKHDPVVYRNEAGTTLLTNKIYAYTVNSDGNYELEDVTGMYAAGTAESNAIANKKVDGTDYDFFASKTSFVNGLTLNSATKFIVYKSGNSSVKTYDGVANMVNITEAQMTKAAYLYETGAKAASVVFVNATGSANNTASADEIFYLMATEPTVTKSGSDRYYTYNVVKDGKADTITMKKNNQFAAIATDEGDDGVKLGLWTITEYDGDYVSEITKAAPKDYKFYQVANVGGNAEYADGVLTVNTSSFDCDADVPVYLINEDDAVSVGNADSLTNSDATYVYNIVTKTNNNVEKVVAVYVEQDA